MIAKTQEFGENILAVEYPDRGLVLVLSSPLFNGERDRSPAWLRDWMDLTEHYVRQGYLPAPYAPECSMTIPVAPGVPGDWDIHTLRLAE